MTKKDYTKFATLLKDLRERIKEGHYYGVEGLMMLEDVEVEMIRLFQEDNPRFDAERFLRAAEVE